jgi:hypothetical protein
VHASSDQKHKANEIVPSECFIRVKSIPHINLSLPKKTVVITIEVPIMSLTISGASSRDEAYTAVSFPGFYNGPVTRPVSPDL